MTYKAEVQVEGASTLNYKDTIEKKLGNLKGVDSFHIDQETKKVSVVYDETKVNLFDIKQSIMEEGFSVIEI